MSDQQAPSGLAGLTNEDVAFMLGIRDMEIFSLRKMLDARLADAPPTQVDPTTSEGNAT